MITIKLQLVLLFAILHCSRAQLRTEYAPAKPMQHLQHHHHHHQQLQQPIKAAQNVVAEMQVICHSDAILLKMNTNTPFNGMVYARGEPHSSNCVSEFNSATNMTFRLPLKACGTLFSEVDDGIEYFNTVVVQPHMRLMTNQGKGYHIRCKYQTRERTIANTQFNVSASFHMQDAPKSTTPILATASMPSCTMKIFRKGRSDIAESVKIGDKLVMVIEIDRQDMYGMRISNCVVRDGLNVAEQLLIDNVGCPLDETIMPSFEYSNNYTRAAVSFPAHKFPHTSSVYYQCNISLCINNGNCIVPECKHPAAPAAAASQQQQAAASTNIQNAASSNLASSLATTSSTSSLNGNNAPANGITMQPSAGSRRKRHSNLHNNLQQQTHSLQNTDPANGKLIKASPSNNNNNLNSKINGDTIDRFDDMSFDVYSGLYVNDATDEDPINNENTADEMMNSSSASSATVKTAPTSSISNLSRDNNAISEFISNFGQRSITFLLIAMCSIVILMALACQIGLVGRSSIGRRGSSSNGANSQVPSASIVQLSHSRRRHDHHSANSKDNNPLGYHCYECTSS